MANIINATQTGNGGLVTTGDDSGVLNIQTNETTAVTIDASQVVSYTNNLGTVAGYPAYQCRAWVNFNGTGTVAIRASGNVSSITDGGTGNFSVNFTNAMPDTNYSVVATAYLNEAGTAYAIAIGKANTTSQVTLGLVQSGTATTLADSANTHVAIFR